MATAAAPAVKDHFPSDKAGSKLPGVFLGFLPNGLSKPISSTSSRDYNSLMLLWFTFRGFAASHGFEETIVRSESGRPIYLDMQATTPTDPRVVEAMLPYFTQYFGNPHSRTHQYGWESEEAVEKARKVRDMALQRNDWPSFVR